MKWLMKEEFKKAYEKAALILSKLNLNCSKAQKMVRTADIIDAVEKELGLDVKFTTYDFKEFRRDGETESSPIEQFGAAMCVSNESGSKRQALILLNEKETPKMQRFSLVHELGHLMLQDWDNTKGYKVSTHINMKITSIPDHLLDNPKFKFLIEEEQANIFALLVLVPFDSLVETLKKDLSFSKVAKIYGVEKEAIMSRVLLANAFQEVTDGEEI